MRPNRIAPGVHLPGGICASILSVLFAFRSDSRAMQRHITTNNRENGIPALPVLNTDCELLDSPSILAAVRAHCRVSSPALARMGWRQQRELKCPQSPCFVATGRCRDHNGFRKEKNGTTPSRVADQGHGYVALFYSVSRQVCGVRLDMKRDPSLSVRTS
jgi:hypothetical protein